MPWVYRMTVLLSLFLLPVFVYVGFRLAAAIKQFAASRGWEISKKKTRLVVFAVILWFYLLPIIFIIYYLWGNFHQLFVFKPSLQWQDYLLLFPFWWGVLTVIEIVPYFAFLDILSGLSRLSLFSTVRLRLPEVLRHRLKLWLVYIKVGLVLFFLIYVGCRTYLDTYRIRISETSVAIENLPAEFQGLNLCLFGDIHVNRFTPARKLEKLKDFLQSSDNSLIFFTGDLVSRGIDYIDKALDVTCNPRGYLANIACMGDHDYWAAPRKISREMKQCGWKFLQNNHYLISYKGRQILVTGITHIYSQRITSEELEKILANAPVAHLKILVVHQPMEFLIDAAARYGYHLVLAGHTHGGQMVPHIFGFPITPSRMETRYYRGIYKVGGLYVIVTNGIGQTLAPLRYHAPAEIDRITLLKK